MDAAVAGGLRPRRGCRARRAAPCSSRAATRTSSKPTPGWGSRSMRSSSACSSSRARLGHTWKPRQPRFTAHTMCARSAATSASDVVPFGRAHHRGLEPVGGVLRHPLLEERRPVDPVGEPLHEHRAPADRAHELVLDRAVVVDDVELGLPVLREHDLVGAGDADHPPGHLDVHRDHGIAVRRRATLPRTDEGEPAWVTSAATRSRRPGPSTSSGARSSEDWPAWADMFTDDARYEEHNLGVFEGTPAITKFIVDVMKEYPAMTALDRVVDHRRRSHRLLHLEQPARPDRHREALRRSPTPRSSQYGGDGKFSFEGDYYNPADAERVFTEWLTDGGRATRRRTTRSAASTAGTPSRPTPAFPREEVEAEFEKYRERALARGGDRRLGPVGRPVHRRRPLPRAPLRLLHVGQPRSGSGSSR